MPFQDLNEHALKHAPPKKLSKKSLKNQQSNLFSPLKIATPVI